MNTLTLSVNGLYLLNEEKIYFTKENKSYDLNEITFSQWVDIFMENTSFAIQNKLIDSGVLYSFHRKMVYQLSEHLSFDKKNLLIFEYESKFNNTLLTEDTLILENWFTDAWKWTKDKFNQLGGWAVTLGKNLASCAGGSGCSPFFKQFRELMFNPASVGLQVFISTAFPGVGNIGMGILWGILTIYDGYLLVSGSSEFSWWNLFFDIVGVVLSGVGAAAAFRSAAGGTKVVASSAGASLDDVIGQAVKNPRLTSTLTKIGESLGGLMSKLKPAADFLMNKLGLKWVGKAFSAIENVVAKLITKIGPKSLNPKIATATGKGVRTSAEMIGIEKGIHGINKLIPSGPSELEKGVMDANKKIKADYRNIEW